MFKFLSRTTPILITILILSIHSNRSQAQTEQEIIKNQRKTLLF